MKLMLGTAQFGLHYGISNTKGQTSRSEVKSILQTAKENGIRFLDTAASYGESEKVLGECLGNDGFEVVTKLAYLTKNLQLTVRDSFNASLEQLVQNKVYGLLFHDPEDLLGPRGERNFAEVMSLKDRGEVLKIGASVYTPAQAEAICEKFKIDLIQIPLSVVDQRFITSGVIRALKNNNIEIHSRSVFLQGLLVMGLERLPKFFEPILPKLKLFYERASQSHMTPQAAALGFVKQISDVDKIIVGVNDSAQLMELCEIYHKTMQVDSTGLDIGDEKFVLPMNWKTA